MQYVGKNIERLDGKEKVLGLASYTFDLDNFPNLLYAKMLTSPHPHANIKSIDFSFALTLPGVISIVTGKDFSNKTGLYAGDRDLLAVDRVTWVGQPVAAVVAETEQIAEEAVTKINVEYEILPAIFDPIEAKDNTEILVHPDLATYDHLSAFTPQPGTNIANHFKLRRGNINKGFEEADQILEGKYQMPQVSHAYMETISTIAHYKIDGSLDVISSAQSPFTVQYLLGITFGIPLQKIRVQAPFSGGGFGGKAGLNFEPLVVLLSQKSNYRPVKLRLTREENFYSAAIRVGLIGKIKTGVKNDGRIVAEEIEYILDSGACADYAVNVGRATGYAATGPYDIDNIKADSLTIYTNKPYATAFRGFGHMELHFCIERQREKIAKKLGIDSAKFRMINTLKPGKSFTANSVRLREDAGNVDECITAVSEELLKRTDFRLDLKPWEFRGKGIACFMKSPAQPPNSTAASIIKFRENGSIYIEVGTSEIGQGTITGLAQIAAEVLSIPIEKIRIKHERDTDADAYTWQTVGSRSLFMDGNAVINAALDAKKQIFDVVSQIFHVPPEDLELEDESVYIKGKRWKKISLSDVVMGYMYPDGTTIGGPIIGRGYHTAKMTNLDPDTGAGNPSIFRTFGAQGIDLIVNVLTGEIKILRCISAFDVGRVINPVIFEGQVIGGAVMAASLGMQEELLYNNNGELLNPNLVDYCIMRAQDIPHEFKTITITNPQLDGPFGARGIGELTMIGVPAAIGNALGDALDIDFDELPLSPERVLSTIKRNKPELIDGMLELITNKEVSL